MHLKDQIVSVSNATGDNMDVSKLWWTYRSDTCWSRGNGTYYNNVSLTPKLQPVIREISGEFVIIQRAKHPHTEHSRRSAFWNYDTIAEFNVDSKAEYSALPSTRSQKKKLKQTTPVPL